MVRDGRKYTFNSLKELTTQRRRTSAIPCGGYFSLNQANSVQSAFPLDHSRTRANCKVHVDLRYRTKQVAPKAASPYKITSARMQKDTPVAQLHVFLSVLTIRKHIVLATLVPKIISFCLRLPRLITSCIFQESRLFAITSEHRQLILPLLTRYISFPTQKSII
jgi:hypothetical protein